LSQRYKPVIVIMTVCNTQTLHTELELLLLLGLIALGQFGQFIFAPSGRPPKLCQMRIALSENLAHFAEFGPEKNKLCRSSTLWSISVHVIGPAVWRLKNLPEISS
jgi:hypothetical protein